MFIHTGVNHAAVLRGRGPSVPKHFGTYMHVRSIKTPTIAVQFNYLLYTKFKKVFF